MTRQRRMRSAWQYCSGRLEAVGGLAVEGLAVLDSTALVVHSFARNGKTCMTRQRPCGRRRTGLSARTAWAPSRRHSAPTAGIPLKLTPTPCWPPCMLVCVLAPDSSAVPATPHQPGWIPSRSQEFLKSRGESSRLPSDSASPSCPTNAAPTLCNTSFSAQNLGGKTILAPLRSPKAYMLFGCA
jgi:hypothetical protein